MVVSKLDLSSLQDDGDTLELDDSRKVRLRIEQDDIDPFEQFDCYGRIARLERHGERPDGFDGNAEKLSLYDNTGTVWWQPPTDGPKRGTALFASLRKLVIQLATYGNCGVVLELLVGWDAYGAPIVRQTASLWGIDSLGNGYLAQVVSELAAELEIERG